MGQGGLAGGLGDPRSPFRDTLEPPLTLGLFSTSGVPFRLFVFAVPPHHVRLPERRVLSSLSSCDGS